MSTQDPFRPAPDRPAPRVAGEPVPAPPSTSRVHSACTLLLLRDGASGIEVLMVERAAEARFLGGYHVFPGGRLVADDASPRALVRIVGLSAAEAGERLETPDALAWWMAAVRETYEECGILLAVDASGSPPDGAARSAFRAARPALNAGEVAFSELLLTHGLFVRAPDLAYFDRWITPAFRPQRFDTRFFAARAPAGQDAIHDGAEVVAAAWLRAAEAISAAKRGEISIANATETMLRRLADQPNVDTALAAARATRRIEPNRICVAQGSAGRKFFYRDDPQYAEIHWCDPDETMQTSYEIVPGIPKRLDRWVTRLTAPNPGVMTGPGTNTYFVGEREFALVDPGPDDARHLEAVLRHGQGRIRWILCTHAHRDHSPAAATIARDTGAQVIGMPAPAGLRHDPTFAPDRIVVDGETLRLGEVSLTVIHTPGHAANHLCFRLGQSGMVFTGDHVMQGSTVTIGPPDGDMRAYLASLEKLLAIDAPILAPGHGYLIGVPGREIRRLIRHRRWREARVLDAVRRLGPASVDELVGDVYPQIPPALHRAAAQSLEAHLVKLVDDDAVVAHAGRYTAASR
ncbi:MAG: MBL fold metallo-hydrolase [Burkholderiales bacterium]